MRARRETQTPDRRDSGDAVPLTRVARSWIRAAFVENATLKLVAFMLALTVFFLVHSDKRAVVNLSVGVSYTLPTDKVLAMRPPSEVRLTVRGSRRIIKRVDEREIERIHIDLPDITGEFVFQNEMVRLPAGLELVSINPASFPLRVERPLERNVPIEINLRGSLPNGFEVIGRAVEPDSIGISGAESVVKRTDSIVTRPVSLDGRTKSFVTDVALGAPEGFIEVEEVQSVRVRIDIGAKLGTKELGKQKVSVVPGPNIDESTASRFTTEPAEVVVALSGPILKLADVDQVTVEVAVTAADLVPGSQRRVPLLVRGLPEGVASEIRPAEITLSLR